MEDGSSGTRAASDDQLVPLLEDALSALGEGDSRLRVQLLSRLAAALRGDPSHERRARLCEEAVQTARRLGEPAVIAYALDRRRGGGERPRTPRSGGWPRPPRSSPWRGASGTGSASSTATSRRIWAAWELGDPDRRAAGLASLTRVAEELQQPAQLWMAASGQAALALAQGRFAEAEQLIERAVVVGERALSWNAAASRRRQDFILRRVQGRLEGLEPEIRRSPTTSSRRRSCTAPCWPTSARARSTPLRRRRSWTSSSGHDLSGWHLDEEWLFSVCLLAETCAIVGRFGAGRRPLRGPAAPRPAQRRRRPRGHARLHEPASGDPREHDGPLRGRGAALRGGPAHEREDGGTALGRAHGARLRPDARGARRVRRPRAGARARRPGAEGYRSLGMDSYAAEAAGLQRSLEVAPAR